ncbi:MAG: dihydrodipicolinate synthase family protein [Propionibacteriaceae bacterium]|jgi:4-hydroxy-2-oxoglutarate aldolase|nr:dihydrodipicolinate synthase family protein [Propionibacteriaceae bacterium]
MTNQKLRGIIIPAASPFQADESLDIAGLEANLARWDGTDVVGYMVLGSNGEFRSLSDDESRQVIATAVGRSSEKTLIVGIGRESLHETLAFMRSIEPLADRIDYYSVLTPSYFAKLMDSAALEDYYLAIAEASPLPIMLYVAPGFANGVVVEPALLAKLADYPNIAGVKDTSPTMMADYMAAAGGRDDFTILAGSLNNIMAALDHGGPGGVVSAANYLPEACARLTTLYHAGDHEGAKHHYEQLQTLAKATGAAHGVAGLKACMTARGFAAGAPRRPVQALDGPTQAALAETLATGLAGLDDATGGVR